MTDKELKQKAKEIIEAGMKQVGIEGVEIPMDLGIYNREELVLSVGDKDPKGCLDNLFSVRQSKEGSNYWHNIYQNLPPKLSFAIPTPSSNTPSHYDNSKGSLYKFAEDHKLNSWEFDIIKRITRCRKKGNWLEDLEKTKAVIDLYIKEFN